MSRGQYRPQCRQNAINHLLAGASPDSVGELITLPQTPSWICGRGPWEWQGTQREGRDEGRKGEGKEGREQCKVPYQHFLFPLPALHL